MFKGLASVTNGEFSVDFVLLRNIQLSKEDESVSFYAKKSNALDSQLGAQNVNIGGVNTYAT